LKCALLPLKALKAGVWGLAGWPDEEEEEQVKAEEKVSEGQ
jgi:hypothetical protein